MVTPHINAKENSFSDIVLMPGDPIRAKYIAEKYLEHNTLVSNVRSILGYTGFYKNRKVSVFSHGIGIPSCSIYVYELVKFYHVKKIIRIGTCGTIREDIKLLDIIVGLSASTDSNVNKLRFDNYDFSVTANFNMVLNIIRAANNLREKLFLGSFFTTDLFYFLKDNKRLDLMKKYNILGIEMETSGLYGLSSELGIQSVALCSVTDHILKKEKLDAKNRETNFDKIVLIALESILLKNKYNLLNF